MRWCIRRIFKRNFYTVSPGMVIRRFPDVKSVTLKGEPHFTNFNLVPESWGGICTPGSPPLFQLQYKLDIPRNRLA
ncbi:hypothetical protein C1H46_000980 [Malus baccata]|uniref:Transport inhibitor response 1 domain-containing protein n=1 Tax=Malus baccata TaxID=106549 RepID=A0A540NS15_MALBA|nr:hypothetical protein C1H46_000980 [Malus baccata]